MKVFLVPNYYKQEAVESGLMLELWLTRQGYEVAWAADQRSKIQSTPDIDGSDLVITLGGDGTLLRAARMHLVMQDRVAEIDTLVADIDVRPRDDPVDLLLPLAAEGAADRIFCQCSLSPFRESPRRQLPRRLIHWAAPHNLAKFVKLCGRCPYLLSMTLSIRP